MSAALSRTSRQVALSRQQLYGAGAATDGGPAVFLGRVIAYHPASARARARALRASHAR